MQIDLEELGSFVRAAGQEELLPRFNRVGHEYKADGSVLTEADLAVDQRLKTQLQSRYPETAFLSEEMAVEDQERLLRTDERPLWCLDPLDGTSNFAAGIPYFGISLALIHQGEVEIGIIYDPVLDECFAARRDAGATLNGSPLQAPAAGISLAKAIALVDFKRLSPELRQRFIIRSPYHSQRNFGSCALEWAWMAAGRGHVYLHGGQKLWDLAAGSLILREAGGHCQTLEGEAVFRPAMTPRSVVSSPDAELFAAWRDWLG